MAVIDTANVDDAGAAVASTTLADTIHPPHIVTLSPLQDYTSGQTAAPLPDSPLSSPPDSPRSIASNDEHKGREDDNVAYHRPGQPLQVKPLGLPCRSLDIGGEETLDMVEGDSPGKVVEHLPNTTIRRAPADAPFDEHQKKRALLPRPSSMKQTNGGGGSSNNNINSDVRSRQDLQLSFEGSGGGSGGVHKSKNDSDVPDDEKKVDDSFYSSAATSGGPVWGDDEEWMMMETTFEMEPGRIVRSSSTLTAGGAVENREGNDDDLSEPPSLAPKSPTQPTLQQSSPSVENGVESQSDAAEPPSLARPNFVTMKQPDNTLHAETHQNDVGRAQHLSFAALKQNIVSKSGLPDNPAPSGLRPDENATRSESFNKMLNATMRKSQQSESPKKTEGGTPLSKESNLTLDSGDLRVTAGIVSTANHMMATPDGDDENFELSIMMSPDGEIDPSKPIITLPSSSALNQTANRPWQSSDTIDMGVEENDNGEDCHRSADKMAIHHLSERPSKDELSRHEIPVDTPDGSSPNHQPEVISVKTASNPGQSSPRSAGGYTPPESCSDYLTFRGVVTTSPDARKGSESAETKWHAKESIEGSILAGFGSQHVVEIKIKENVSAEDSRTAEPSQSLPVFRKMTPNKDLQMSEKSAGWLQEELRRRAFIKQEINEAILAQGKSPGDAFGSDTCGSVGNPVEFSVESFDRLQDSHSVTDDEVAAITAEDGRAPRTDGSREFATSEQGSADVEDPVPLILDYDNREQEEGSDIFVAAGAIDVANKPLQVEMRKFASVTRQALRDHSFTETQKFQSEILDPPLVSGIAENPSMDASEPMIASAPLADAVGKATSKTTKRSSGSTGTDFADLQVNESPVMIQSMDCFDGIAKGDIMLSLLSENTGRVDASVGATWGKRVHGAIWRSRLVRRSMSIHPGISSPQPLAPGSAARGRPSLPLGLDRAKVVVGFRTVASTENAALQHLRHDEVDEAIELTEDIIFAYYSYFERSLNTREKNPNQESAIGSINFKPYIGVALHNLGVLNLLRGEYREADSYFTRAIENRKSHAGEGHPDHVVSTLSQACWKRLFTSSCCLTTSCCLRHLWLNWQFVAML